ncbi:LysR family transcriptional regulator [Evansella tamaricis]|uniref:LysR family transcriptional regulator n=1 Tax=Evansella tamaricis TaxID=2069301 RepID=A0ABS6JJ54_9BACI|nr:LysR family transcriptional regulator [Evansella tamaricis]MBU9713682.1 LysR family transcriptional regulator [Evansella tamaricis]
MNIKQMKVFVLVAKHHNLETVANIIGCKQPTVTFHLKKLEEFAGVPLFKHTNKFFSLTDAGQTLLIHAKEIIRLSEGAVQSLKDYQQLKKGSVIIGSSYTPATNFIPKILRIFLERYPNIDPQLIVSRNSPEINSLIKGFEIDIGIITDTYFQDDELVSIPISKDELGLVMHPDHPFASMETITPQLLMILDTPFLLRETGSSSRNLIDKWMMEHDVKVTKPIDLGSTEIIKQSVLSNVGISILSNLAVKREVEEQRLIFKPLNSEILSRTVYLAYHRSRYLSPILKDFISVFQFVSGDKRA